MNMTKKEKKRTSNATKKATLIVLAAFVMAAIYGILNGDFNTWKA